MQKLLTIIIPTYNMQDYLGRCLDSLIVSDDMMQSLEVLVINDGSKDRSSQIAYSYQDRFPNTFRVIDKENGNYGSCVNRGLKEATGKYIKVLDADDWFGTANFISFLEELESMDMDMVITDFNQVDNDGTVVKTFRFKLPYNSPFLFQEIKDAEYYGLHSITYKTQLLREMNYRQTEGISYTDTEWVFYPQTRVQKAIYLPLNVYHYVIGREGQTMDPQVLLKSAGHYTELIRNMIEFSDNLSECDARQIGACRLEAQIKHLSCGVYKICLIKQNRQLFDESLLSAFDNLLKNKRPIMYQEIGKLRLNSYLPLSYVRFWRLLGIRFPVDAFREIYRRIRYGKA